jgi:hypothetical protein
MTAAERGWLQPVPRGIQRAGGVAALLGTVALLAAMGTGASIEASSWHPRGSQRPSPWRGC